MTREIQLKTLRELKNLTQGYIAIKMGISQSYYSKLENGYSPLDSEMELKALSAMGIKNPPPMLVSKVNLLESLEQHQNEFVMYINRILSLEGELNKLKSEISNLKEIVANMNN